jgi:hypothetical protein
LLPLVCFAAPPARHALRCPLLLIPFLHVADDGLPTIMDMHMLDADKLLPAVTAAAAEPQLASHML